MKRLFRRVASCSVWGFSWYVEQGGESETEIETSSVNKRLGEEFFWCADPDNMGESHITERYEKREGVSEHPPANTEERACL